MSNPYRYLRTCAWAGPIMLVATILFWGLLGHNIPPYAADLSATVFAEYMREHTMSIRIGMVGQMAVTSLYLVWGLSIAKVMETVEQDNNILSTLQIWGAGFTAMVFMIPCSIWLTVVFRPETADPDTLQLFYDFGWLFFDLAWSLTTMGMIAMGICFLSDQREVPLMPAWVCWLAIFVGISFILESFMPFLKSGAFSRSGTLNYWIEFSLFFLYWLTTAIYILKAITRLEQEHLETAAAG